MAKAIQGLEQEIADLRRADQDLRSQNNRLFLIVKNLGRKLVNRLPISLESLEKGLDYDLIFSEEVDAWRSAISNGMVLDLRSREDFSRGAILGAVNISLDQISEGAQTISVDRPILLVCENGIKSVAACEILNAKGFQFLYVLKGGMSLYRGELLPVESVIGQGTTSTLSN